MELFLPDLVYCDRRKVIDLLSILVNDVITEYSLKLSEDKTLNKGLEVDFTSDINKIAARYQVGNSRAVEREGIVKLPTASLFSDLYTILNSKDKIQRLIGFDDDIWSQLKVGEFIELDGTFVLSPPEAAFYSLTH